MSERAPIIAIVDDDPSDVEIMKIFLREEGLVATLEVYEDGEQASRRFSDPRPGTPWPDLVLLDLNLPKKDGREVLIELKSNARTWDIPVIILTTAASREEIMEFETFKSTTCLIKPYVLKEYGPILARILGALNGV
jgi:DNA-binding response OmpR family regulator